MKKTKVKTCENCGQEYSKNYFNRKKMFENSKFCSRRCKGIGRLHSEETKKKISESHKGIKHKPHSEEWKREMSLAHKGERNHFYGKHHSQATRDKLSKKRKGVLRPERQGKNCHLWKGGISPLNIIIRTSLEARIWRRSILERDNYTCQKCGMGMGELCAHHIYNFAQYPELRFAIDNGITLCVKHHKEFHRIYGQKNNFPEQIATFIKGF